MTAPQITVLILVGMVLTVVPLVVWWNRRGARRTAGAGAVLTAALQSWALSHGWHPVPPPPKPAVAQRVAVRSLAPLAAVRGRLGGQPAQLSLWSAARSHLGSPVRFRSVVWVASAQLIRTAGPEPFGLGSLTSVSTARTAGDVLVASQTSRMVTVPRVLAARHATHPWGVTRIPVWPSATLPADPQRWAAVAAELDRLDAFLLVQGTEVSLSVPAGPPSATAVGPSPDDLLRTLELAAATVGDVRGQSAHEP